MHWADRAAVPGRGPFPVARVGRLWASPWPPPSSAHPAPSPSVSSCRPHSPQWWLQASTLGQPAGGREGPESQRRQRLELPFPLDSPAAQALGAGASGLKGSDRSTSKGRHLSKQGGGKPSQTVNVPLSLQPHPTSHLHPSLASCPTLSSASPSDLEITNGSSW